MESQYESEKSIWDKLLNQHVASNNNCCSLIKLNR